jgi:hypothetical protein
VEEAVVAATLEEVAVVAAATVVAAAAGVVAVTLAEAAAVAAGVVAPPVETWRCVSAAAAAFAAGSSVVVVRQAARAIYLPALSGLVAPALPGGVRHGRIRQPTMVHPAMSDTSPAFTPALSLLTSPGIHALIQAIIQNSHDRPVPVPCPFLPLPAPNTEMNEALGLLTGAFANISIKGQQVGLPAPGQMPAFALRANAGGQGKAGKPSGACVVRLWLSRRNPLLGRPSVSKHSCCPLRV